MATRLARKVVEEAHASLERVGWDWAGSNKLLRAAMLLEPPLETHQLQNAMLPAAQAYDLVFEVRKTCDPTVFGCEYFAKPAALPVREVLVMQICCSSISMNDAAFESSLERSFGRQLDTELRSQLHLARAALC